MNRTWIAAAAAALAALAALPSRGPRALAAGPTPTITDVSPARGPVAGGTTVTITGTDFTAPITVTIGGTAASTVMVKGPTVLTCVTPAHPRGAADVIVTQASPPATPSAPAVGAFTFEEPAFHAWVPRAAGSATGGNPGGFDVSIVDVPNRRVVASLDLNASDPDLPTDDDWRVTQVLFDSAGAHAFLATAGTPGTRDSQKVFIVRTARALGTEAGAPVLASVDTDGNPVQVALSSTGTKLYVADAGSWAGAAFPLPNGTLRAYDVTDRANPAISGTPAAVGVLPVLAYDASSYQGWGTNSAFRGTVQSVPAAEKKLCVVTNAGSRTLTVVDLETLAVSATVDVGVTGGGPIQTCASIPSPYSDDILFVQTTAYDLTPAPVATEYFYYRVSTNTLVEKGVVAVPVQFFPLAPFPDLQNRMAWAHPDGESMVAVPLTDPSVATWRPATGGATARTAIQGGGPPPSLAFNDATGFFYARELDGGWTVFSVADSRGAPPVDVKKVPDATGVNSLRVVKDGSLLLGTRDDALAVVDGQPGSATVHGVIDAVALPLDPAGGAVFPQPGANGGAARTFVEAAATAPGPRVVLPLAGTDFSTSDEPPEFAISGTAGNPLWFEIEMGNQYDFLPVPGSLRARVRIPSQEFKVRPDRRTWLRVLRSAAGAVERPFYARANAVLPGGVRVHGPESSFRVSAPTIPLLAAPNDGAAASRGVPPSFTFVPGGPGRFHVEFAGPDGFDKGVLGRFAAPGDGAGPVTDSPTARAWRQAVDRARGRNGSYPVTVEWRARVVDALGRTLYSGERSLLVSE